MRKVFCPFCKSEARESHSPNYQDDDYFMFVAEEMDGTEYYDNAHPFECTVDPDHTFYTSKK